MEAAPRKEGVTDETEAGRAVLGGGAACSFRLWGAPLSIESRQWELSAVLDGETGAVVACGPSWQEAYLDAAVVSLSCQAQGGDTTHFTGAEGNLHRHLPAGGALPKRTRCTKSPWEGSTGQAVCSTTTTALGEQAPTLVLTFPAGLHPVFYWNKKP